MLLPGRPCCGPYVGALRETHKFSHGYGGGSIPVRELQRLAENGINLFFKTIVGDNPERMESIIKKSLDRADIVITSGGIGPTKDDLTREIVAKATERKIITDQETETRKIINFCNLSWEDDCLSFHKNKTPIKTMSTAQARQPIYKSSLNSYEKFSPFLETLNKII